MKKGYFWIAASLLFVFNSCTSSQEEQYNVEDTFGSIDSLLNVKFEKEEFNGNSLIVFQDSLFQKSYGYSRHREKLLLNVDNIFYLGSLAKQFTGMGIMLLADEKKLELDESLTSYIDSLPPICNSITIRQMLNHTSGLPDYYRMGIYKSGMTNQVVLDAMRELESLDFEPGTQYSYSNSAYVLLSLVIEKASGQSFGNYLNEKVFSPLGMDNTFVYDESRPSIPNRALGHYRNGNLNDYNAFTTGGGGIFSNLKDLYLWIEALDSKVLVSSNIMDQSYQEVTLNDSTVSYYGFGWMLSEEHPEIVRHSGSLVGYRTYMYRNRANGTVVLLLSNFTDNVGDINQDILKILNEPI